MASLKDQTPTTGSKSDQDLRILLITLEYAEQYVFSGNGVYSRSFVHNLVRSGGTRVMVLCGRPAGQQTRLRPLPPSHVASASTLIEANPHGNGTSSDFIRESSKIEVYTVSLPVWFKLDRHSSWRELGEGVGRYASKVAQFKPDIVLGVDWTSRPAWETLRKHPDCHLGNVPFVYLCFRVFSATLGLSQEDRSFYSQREAEILHSAVRTVALSRCDALALDELRMMTLPRGNDAVKAASASLIQIITPPLRDDVRNASLKFSRIPSMASSNTTKQIYPIVPASTAKWNQSHLSSSSTSSSSTMTANLLSGSPDHAFSSQRLYVTCCCRVSPEKEVMRFVELVEASAAFFKAHELVPYLVGPVADEEYARKVYQRLKRSFPGDSSIVVSDFVPADKLQSIFAKTILNIHPARSEPFGMSITEAAAFAVPTLLDGGGAIGATDVLPFTEHRSIPCNMRSIRQASAVLRSILKVDARSFLELVGKRAQDAVMRWGSSEWATHVRKELLKDVLQTSFRAFDSSASRSPTTSARLENVILSPPRSLAAFDAELARAAEDATWPWVPMTQWAVEQLAEMNSGEVVSQNVVLEVDVDGVRLVIEQLLALSAYALASLMVSAKQQQQKHPVEMNNEMLAWARYFLGQHATSSLGPARFRLVPSRLSEDAFWVVFFGLVRDGVQRLVANSKGGRVSETNETTSPEPDTTNDEVNDTPPPKFVSPIELKAAAMERLVQRDECARGIAPIVEFVGSGMLLESARSIFSAKRVIILTGFPCLVNGPSPQETDGPPGAVALARACSSLGKQVTFVIEEPIANVLRASISPVFPKARAMLLRSHGLTKVESFGPKGRVTLEIFPPKTNFTEGHLIRLKELLGEIATEQGHLIAIERAGPASDGKCRTMRGRVMDDSLLAPLHLLFEKAKEANLTTTGIGDGGNEVGMGAAYDVVKTKMGENIACVTGCDFLIPSSVSNWGGYALCGALGLVAVQSEAMSSDKAADLCIGSDQVHLDIIKSCMAAGAGDGITGQKEFAAVDGLPFSKSLEIVAALRTMVRSFKREM